MFFLPKEQDFFWQKNRLSDESSSLEPKNMKFKNTLICGLKNKMFVVQMFVWNTHISDFRAKVLVQR